MSRETDSAIYFLEEKECELRRRVEALEWENSELKERLLELERRLQWLHDRAYIEEAS